MFWLPDLYTKNRSIFLDYLDNIDSKKFNSNFCINLIKKIPKNEKIVISDIWAWNWIIAKILIKYLEKENINYEYNYIEPSIILVDNFKNENIDIQNINYINSKIEDVILPASDIFILSFVLQSIWDAKNILKRIYDNLKNNWNIVIINQNIENIDFQIKKLLWYNFWDVTKNTINNLNDLNIAYKHIIEESNFYWCNEIINLTDIGKNCLSFMLYKEFKYITNSELEKVFNFVKTKSENWKLIRKEDYILISK